MSAPVFVKVTMTVLFQDLSSADYYRECADEIDVSDDEDGEASPRCVAEDSDRQRKQWLLERANELDREDMPNVDELYEFLSSCDTDKLRFLEMIEDANCYRPHRSAKIYVEGERVKISYVTTAEPDHFGYESPEDMERFINQEPFFKSRTGGHVGNYCKFPSRENPEDQLGELEMVADVVRITEGGDAWEEPVRDWLAADPSRAEVTISAILAGPIGLDKARWGRGEQMRAGQVMRGLGYERVRTTAGGAREYIYRKATT
jgi:hypothetical protein